jgi:hypothetical protein
MLQGEKTEQSTRTLAKIWRLDRGEAFVVASELAEIGFFERRGSKEDPAFWVPLLYRDGLRMVQGGAG